MAKKSVADYPHLQAVMNRRMDWAVSRVEDNGLIHYGSGLRGSLCGVENPKRKETPHWTGVTCHKCRGEAARRIPKTPTAPPTRFMG
jgi:hypothetical protein